MDSDTINKLRAFSKIRLLDTIKTEELIAHDSTEEAFQQYFTDNPEVLSLVVSSPICHINKENGEGQTR